MKRGVLIKSDLTVQPIELTEPLRSHISSKDPVPPLG